MNTPGWILLTGATGLLGRFLWRDLLRAGFPVVVLARADDSRSAHERLAQLHSFWCEQSGQPLPNPVVVEGTLDLAGLGLGPADRAWLGRRVRCVVHSAANVSLGAGQGGEPWRTNVEGTGRLLSLCRSLGVSEFHHVSTAFVCGDRPGPISEDDLESGQGFHNDYEKSKWQAEQLLRAAGDIQATIYRPAVLVGASQTGYTSSYHAFYRFLELADRLARPSSVSPGAKRFLPLRLPFTGEELHNLVPVDWVSGAITTIVGQPRAHGRTYHLVSEHPIPGRCIREAVEELLGIAGIEWAGPQGPANPTPLERMVDDCLREYWPYRQGDPVFDCTNTQAALPDTPAPLLDRALLARLIRFAVGDHWGRRPRLSLGPVIDLDCALYVERFFPAALGRSSLADLPLTVTLALDVFGPGGGQWTCRWQEGRLVALSRGLDRSAEVLYRLDRATFIRIVQGEQAPQEAFFAQQIEIQGAVEKGLKLAVLFEQFVREIPYRPGRTEEVADDPALLA
jgi:thioester reductase-like protein